MKTLNHFIIEFDFKIATIDRSIYQSNIEPHQIVIESSWTVSNFFYDIIIHLEQRNWLVSENLIRFTLLFSEHDVS